MPDAAHPTLSAARASCAARAARASTSASASFLPTLCPRRLPDGASANAAPSATAAAVAVPAAAVTVPAAAVAVLATAAAARLRRRGRFKLVQ